MLKILERVDLDRPILMKEKQEAIEKHVDSTSLERGIIQSEMGRKKVERARLSKHMAEKYLLLLEYIR